MPPNKPSAKPTGIHPDMKIECLPRKPYVVTFDNAVSVLKLAPAANGIGAVLDAWTDPIGRHDSKVLEVEQAMLKEKDLVAALKFCKRLENNWIVAMGLLNEQPHKLDEYVALKFEMRNFEQKFADAKAASEKMELKVQWDEYCAMEPVYEKARPQEAGNSSYIELTMKLFFQAVRFFETCYYSKGSEVLLFEDREHAVLGL